MPVVVRMVAFLLHEDVNHTDDCNMLDHLRAVVVAVVAVAVADKAVINEVLVVVDVLGQSPLFALPLCDD